MGTPHGCILDVLLDGSEGAPLDFRLTPPLAGCNNEATPSAAIGYVVDNLAGPGARSFTLHFIPFEG